MISPFHNWIGYPGGKQNTSGSVSISDPNWVLMAAIILLKLPWFRHKQRRYFNNSYTMMTMIAGPLIDILVTDDQIGTSCLVASRIRYDQGPFKDCLI